MISLKAVLSIMFPDFFYFRFGQDVEPVWQRRMNFDSEGLKI